MKSKFYIMVAVISIIPLLFSITLPYVFAKRLELNTPLIDQHTSGSSPRTYVITLIGGLEYTINVDVLDFWDMDIKIKISPNPYIVAGYIVDSNSFTGDIMNFMPSRSGNYYILIIAKSGSGFFDIRVDWGITSPPTATLTPFYGGIYLLVLILPSSIIFLVGMFILLLIRKKQKNQIIRKEIYGKTHYQEEKVEKNALMEQDDVNFCPFCGNRIKRLAQFCANCGHSIN